MDADLLLLETEEKMDKALEVLKDKLRGMRTGRASPSLIENISVEYYGTQSPLKNIANISAPEPDLLVIKPFDPSSIGTIEKAIQKSDVGIHPQTDGKVLRLKIPPLSQERRKQLVARAKEVAEEARIAIRNIRRDANKHADGLEEDGGLSEDDIKRIKDDIQTLTKTHEDKVEEAFKAKSSELTTM